MINLVKNELIKIFSKKAIYIYTTIVIVLLVSVAFMGKSGVIEDLSGYDSTYVEYLKESLNEYDLNDSYQLRMYIGDRVIIDVEEISKEYSYDSPQRLYIDEVIQPLLLEKYNYEFIDKDLENVNLVQIRLDQEIKKLSNFDWKSIIKDEKKLVEYDITLAENMLKEDKDNKDLKNQLEILKVKLWCLDYRLEHNIPNSYDSKSYLIDTYEQFASEYIVMVKDERLIKDRNELIKKREVESNYNIYLYKLENEMISDNQDMIEYVVFSFSYVDGFVVIAILIIAGSIISEEFNKGTIKQLLIKPFSRSKIFTSKIIASLIAILLFVLLYEGVFLLSNCLEYNNFSSIFGTNIVYDFNLGKVKEVPVLVQCLYGFISVLPAYLIIYITVILVGVLSTNSVASMISGFGLFFSSDLLSYLLKPQILAYMPFYTWDLSPYMYGGLNTNKYATFGTSLLIDILVIILLCILAYIFFNRKEVKNQ